MCLIVFKSQENATFSNKEFKTMITKNPHGLGFMWKEGGRVRVEKVVGREDEQFELFRKHRNRPYYAMHSRMRTHGEINEDNCHPYKILSIDDGDPIDMYLMHNGVIYKAPEENKSMSDTWNYVEHVLRPLAKADHNIIWDNKYIQSMIQEHIGTGSKFIIMRSDERSSLIFNKKAGNMHNGNWLSNTYTLGYYNTHVTHHSHSSVTFGRGHNTEKKETTVTAPVKTISKSATQGGTKKDFNNYDWEGYYNGTGRQAKVGERCSMHGIYTENGFYKKYNDLGQVIFCGEDGIVTSYAQPFYPTGSKPLTIPEKDDKVVSIKSGEPLKSIDKLVYIQDHNEYLNEMLAILKSCSDSDIRATIIDDPTLAVEIIQKFYTKVYLPTDDIINEIQNDKTIDNTVNLIRNLSPDREALKNSIRK